mmetsp:Transcript_44092/g.95819  ORF Transcript_44092/g.95819 Transcript_44092/m.95819 type:complete len:271 (+) Transcript_44092:242-1054(+)
MERHHLVVADGQVVTALLQMCHLHEVSCHQALSDVGIVLLVSEVSTHHWQLQSLHGPLQLLSDVFSRFHGPGVDVAVIAELCWVGTLGGILLVRMEDVQERQMVTIQVREAVLCIVGFLAKLLGSHEDIGHGEHGGNGQNLVAAFEFGRIDQHLCQLGIQGKLRRLVAGIREVAVVIEMVQEVQHLQRSHHRLRRRWIQEIKVHQIVDAQLFQGQHHHAQVGSQDLRICLFRELRSEGLLSVQTEALARPRASGAPGALRRRGLGHRRNQ